MAGALDWISQFFDALALFIPRRVIVRATERGIKWKRGHKIVELEPGIHWWWPIITDLEKIAVARQTMNLPNQALYTLDHVQVSVNAVVTYRINNVILAIGERNWDLDATLQDTAQAAIVEVIPKMTLAEIQDGIDNIVIERLTERVRKRLRKYGASVLRCALTDFTACRVFKLVGNDVKIG